MTMNENEPVACQYCDNTGDVHSIDGEWRGKCTECNPAPAVAQGVPIGYIDTERLEVSGMTWATREKTRDVHVPIFLGSAPAVAQEPVGYLDSTGTSIIWAKKPPNGSKLYTEPPAVAVNEQILSELKNMVRAYVCLLESGKDRITSLGGECDPVDIMEANDSNLRTAKAAIAAAEAAKKGETK